MASLYTLQDIAFGTGGTPAVPTGGVCSKLSNRTDLLARGVYQWIQDAILEISRDFRFQGLERSGPQFQCTAGQISYPLSDFMNVVPGEVITNLMPSLFRFFNPFTPGAGNNAGSTLKWKTIDALELMFQTPGIPTYFTRYNDLLYVAPVPDTTYTAYLRYQVEHPFSDPPVASDPFLLPNEWKEIIEYAAALRGATVLRLLDYSSQYHSTLFGDPEFQRSSGGRGQPGLIARRKTQMETDGTSMMRSIRVVVNAQSRRRR